MDLTKSFATTELGGLDRKQLATQMSETHERCDQSLSYLAEVQKLCKPDCDLYTYSISQTGFGSVRDEQNIWKDNFEGGYFELRYYPDEIYTQISEVLSTSLTGFAWQFGGSMGTWLGGSIIALVHIPMFILDKLWDKWKRVRKVKNIYPSMSKEDGRHVNHV